MKVKGKKACPGFTSGTKVKSGTFPRALLFAFCLFTFYLSCTPDPDPVLNYKDRQFVDSLFRLAIDTLKDEYDSLCLVRYDSAVQFNVDSMMKVRKSEIEKYLERIRQSQQ